MNLTARQICKIINGEIQGDTNITISAFSNIKDGKNGDITFLSDMRYKKYLETTKASLIITPKLSLNTKKTIIMVDDPVKEFTKIIDLFLNKSIETSTISKKSIIKKNVEIKKNVAIGDFAIIEDNVKIGANCVIKPNTFIGKNVTIGNNCKIGPNVSIYRNCAIGSNCIIHAGAVIGGEGFGFSEKNGDLTKMPQVGAVIINKNVEIGSNTTIDRGTLNNTEIHEGVKLDNLIQIGHNVIIRKNTVIAAQCGIAGSTEIGENCMIGGQSAIANHLKIGDNVKIAGKSGVIKNVKNNQIIQGPLAFNIREFQKSYVHFKNLNKIVKQINKIEDNCKKQ